MQAHSIALPNFAPHFHTHHDIYPGKHSRMEAAYFLRYQTYCEECNFLPREQYPTQLEMDLHDPNAQHFSTHHMDGSLVGYVRLVHPDQQGLFPFHQHNLDLFESFAPPPIYQSGEISRLIIAKKYRSRREDQDIDVQSLSEGDRRSQVRGTDRRIQVPQIMLSMYRELYGWSLSNGVNYWYAAMEPSLARVLRQMHFGFQQIGPIADYYGKVAPFLGDLRLMEQRLREKNPYLLEWLQSSSTTLIPKS